MRVTIGQLSAHVGKSERTIERWIKAGRLAAERVAPGVYEVSGELAAEMSANDGTRARLEAIEQRLAHIETLLSEPRPPAQRPMPRKQIGAASQPPVSAAPADLPAGAVHLRDLAAELGINRTTLYGHVKNGKYQAVSIPKANKPQEHDHYFSLEEVARIRADYGKS